MRPILILAAVILLVGCIPQKEYSGELTEKAIVEDVIFVPSQHGSASTVGLSLGSGNIVVGGGDVSIPEKYAVVFRCEHGKFIVQGRSRDKKDLWSRMVKGKEVTVVYREVYMTNGKGERRLVDFDFIDAR